jgi:hypothetical protein
VRPAQDEQGRWNKYGGRLPWDTRAICSNNPTFGGTGNHKVPAHSRHGLRVKPAKPVSELAML